MVNVLDGMQAAFVAFGQEKNGYLYAGDIPAEADIPPADRTLNVKPGDEVMVQVAKSPIGTKGARLSMCLSFVGKNLIYLPTSDFCAVSRKITDAEQRAQLLRTAEKLRAEGGGFVMRTNAADANLPELRVEAKYLRGCTRPHWRRTKTHRWEISSITMRMCRSASCAISTSPT